MTQHRDVIKRLGQAGDIAREMGLNKLSLAGKPGGVGILAAGVVAAYLDEGFEIAAATRLRPRRRLAADR